MDKPLHVQVAEALGCIVRYDPSSAGGWLCDCDEPSHGQFHPDIPDLRNLAEYDSDWSATGPLIEKYRIALAFFRADSRPEWHAQAGPFTSPGPTPLIAACNLILALHKAAKLPTNV